MGSQELKYDAFISYRHSELDKFVAETLHKELEGFRLPSNLLKKMGNQGDRKTKINRVFRDRDELPIASNLADPIVKALESTDFLIVICTPRLPESIWCKTEIETFIKLHGREKVLAVLAEGEPHESFPQAILYDENKNPVEPLAADVRGNTKKDIRKKIKEEVIRLAAPMFECAYDELKQRHRERKLKRIIMASAIGTAVCLVFGLVSTTMALRIRTQSMEIKKQAEKIEEQYTEAMKTNAKSLAADSLRLLEEGDRINAIQTALSALSDNTNQNDMPYTPQAQYALTESLYVYENGYQILPTHILEQDAEISFVKLSPQKDRILIADIYGKVSVWNPLENFKICEINVDTNIILLNDEIQFLNNDLIIYPKERGFAVYSVIDQKDIFECGDIFLGQINVSDDGSKFSVISLDKISVFELNDFKLIYEYFSKSEEKFDYISAFSGTDNYFAFAEESKNEIRVVDLKKNKIIKTISIDNNKIRQMKFYDKELILALEEQSNELIFEETNGKIEIYSTENDFLMKWQYKEVKGNVKEIEIVRNDKKDYIVFQTYSYIGILEHKTGKYVDGCEYAKAIVAVQSDEKSLMLGVITRDGEYHHFNLDTMLDLVLEGKFQFVTTNIKEAVQGKGFLLSLEYGDSKVVIYGVAQGDDWRKLYEGEDYVQNIAINTEEKEIVFSEEDNINVFDVKNEKIKSKIKINKRIEGLSYFGNFENQLVVVSSNNVLCYDITNGKIRREATLSESVSNFHEFIENGEKAIFDNYREIFIYDIENAVIERTIELQESGFDIVYDISDTGKLMAVKNKKENEIQLSNVGDSTIVSRFSCKASMVQKLNIVEKEKLIYVTYLDNKVEIYNYETGEKLKEITQLQEQVEKVFFEEYTRNSLLIGNQETYILDYQKEIIGRIDGGKAMLPLQKKMLATKGKELFAVPFYDMKMLVESTKKQLSK